MKKNYVLLLLVLTIIIFTFSSHAQTIIIGSDDINPRVTITSVGDIMCHKTQYLSTLSDGKYNFSDWFKPIESYIKKADVAICNLETVFAGAESTYSTYPRFNTPENLGQTIKDTGFDIIATANNHSLDRNNHGVVNTINVLDSLNLLHTGTYVDKQSYDTILYHSINGFKIAILNYTYGTNGIPIPKENPYAVKIINEEAMVKDIGNAREKEADLIIFVLHFGNEYSRKPNQHQKSLVNTLFNNGAHIILGSHPHVIQPHEHKTITNIYGEQQDCFVIYSQGNFISNQRKQYRDSGLITNIDVIKDISTDRVIISRVNFTPTWVDRSRINGKYHFRILPIVDSLTKYENNQDPLVNERDYNRLKQVLAETQEQIDK